MSLKPDFHQNRLLAALPATEFGRLSPHLELLALPAGEVLSDAAREATYVYFPATAVVCLLCLMESGTSTGLAIVGNEGMVDVALVLGGATTLGRAIVQSAGYVYRLGTRLLKDELCRGGTLQRLLLRYVQALIGQLGQTAACNRHHTVAQQLSRMLLLTFDRSGSDELAMTQEAIASVLGVRREGVTQAARKLQAQGIIRYTRGRIALLDRHGLESHACECYRAERSTSARFAGELASVDPGSASGSGDHGPGSERARR